jgi:hypothetical protein
MISLRGGALNKHVAKKGSLSSLKDKNDSMVLRSASAVQSKKAVSHTSMTKLIGEVVETSVDGESDWI